MNKFTRTGGIRKAHLFVLELIDQGFLDTRTVLEACLGWMTDEEVEEMATANEFFEYEDYEDEEE